MKKLLLSLSIIIILSTLIYPQETNRSKAIYFRILNDPFNILDEIKEAIELEKKNDMSEKEKSWSVLVACELLRNAGYKTGCLIVRDSYKSEYIEKSAEVLETYPKDEESYPYFIFEKTMNEILHNEKTDNDSDNTNNYPDFTVVNLARGLKLYKNNDYQNALDILFTISNNEELCWEKWWANKYIASIYRELNQLDKAEEYLKKNIEDNPDFPHFYENLGSLYYSQRKYEEALEIVRQGLKKGKYPNLVALLDNIYAKKLTAVPY